MTVEGISFYQLDDENIPIIQVTASHKFEMQKQISLCYERVTIRHQNEHIYMLTVLRLVEEDTWERLVNTSLFVSMRRI